MNSTLRSCLAVAALAWSCCATAPVSVRVVPCLTEAPPVPDYPEAWGVDGGCPVELCLEVGPTHRLLSSLDAADRYARRAWVLCGVTPDAG